MSEQTEIEAQSYKQILTSLCDHLGDIADNLASISYYLEEINTQLETTRGTANRGKASEFSFIRTSNVGD